MTVRSTRHAVFVVVVAAHALVIYVIERCLAPPRTRTPTESPAMVVTFLQELRLPPSPDSAQPAPRAALGEPANDIQPTPDQPPQEQPTNAITDWSAQARAAAAETLRRQREQKEQRAFLHSFAEPVAPVNPGIFGSESANRRSGLVEGGERFWVSDNCYFDFPRHPPLPHAAGEFHLLTRECKPPPTGGGSELFKDLSPDYLKASPSAGWPAVQSHEPAPSATAN